MSEFTKKIVTIDIFVEFEIIEKFESTLAGVLIFRIHTGTIYVIYEKYLDVGQKFKQIVCSTLRRLDSFLWNLPRYHCNVRSVRRFRCCALRRSTTGPKETSKTTTTTNKTPFL